MDRVVVKIRRLGDNEDISLPVYGTEGSSGMDIRASVKEPFLLKPGKIGLVLTIIKCFQ